MLLLIFEDIFQVSKVEVLAGKLIIVSDKQKQILDNALKDLQREKPVQYILGEAYFYGRKFKVNDKVLIPRPETEELVHHILKKMKKGVKYNVLDIGTGSACIPITLTLEHSFVNALALDISSEALEIAKMNATWHNVQVHFSQQDILNTPAEKLPQFLDIVVSNPPYVTLSEKKLMQKNVVDYEPDLALYVPEENPLIFYEVIAEKSLSILHRKGFLFFELPENRYLDIVKLLEQMPFEQIKTYKDFRGKTRFLEARKS